MPVCEHSWTRRRHITKSDQSLLKLAMKSQLILAVEPAGGPASSFQRKRDLRLGVDWEEEVTKRIVQSFRHTPWMTLPSKAGRSSDLRSHSLSMHPSAIPLARSLTLHHGRLSAAHAGLLLDSSSPRCHRRHAARNCPISTSNQHDHQPFGRPVDTPEIDRDDWVLLNIIRP